MKKFLAMLLALVMIFALAACGQAAAPAATEAPTEAPAPVEEPATEAPAAEEPELPEVQVMSYEEYMAADLDTEVVVETYVQAKQSWWDNKATVYTQDQDGAYFLYNMACAEEDYDKLVPGQKIRVTGYKSEWSGEIEIVDASFELLDGDSYIAPAQDVTGLLGKEALEAYQNRFVSVKGATVAPSKIEGDNAEHAFLYNWDGSGEQGSDLYFNVEVAGQIYTFTVESYLCGADTEVYQAVEALKVGDRVNLEGFLYWYEGPNPHITAVLPVAEKSEGVLSYADYAAADLDTEVTVETYVQDKQSWWNDQATLYTQDEDGAYFLYNIACSQEDYDRLLPGTKIKVTGFKSEWSGEVEITDGSFEILPGDSYLAPALDVTELLGSDKLAEHQNKKVFFDGLTVEPSKIEGDETDYAFLYSWDGSGQEGTDSDLYFNASVGGKTYTFVVEYYLRNENSEVYQTVQNLKVGDQITIEGFLYWYNGAQPHVTEIAFG